MQTADQFTEESGRAMYATIPSRASLRVSFEGEEIVPAVDGREASYSDDEVTPTAPVEGADDILRYILHGGPSTPRAIMTRLACISHAGGLLSAEEAEDLGKCTRRTLQLQIQKLRES